MVVCTHADLLEKNGLDFNSHFQRLPAFFTEFSWRSCGDRYLAFNNMLEMEERKKQAKKLLEIIENLAFVDCVEKPPNKCKIM